MYEVLQRLARTVSILDKRLLVCAMAFELKIGGIA
jgi:hypothetical protein